VAYTFASIISLETLVCQHHRNKYTLLVSWLYRISCDYTEITISWFLMELLSELSNQGNLL
jgi:hypothetical protein